MSQAPINGSGRRQVVVEVWLLNLKSDSATRVADVTVTADDTDEPMRNDPTVCAAIALVLSNIVVSVLPMPPHGRVEFRALGNVVRFYSDKEPTEEEAIEMALNLFRETIA